MFDERRSLGLALVDAIAGENRLRREALREDAQAQKWNDRVTFAEARGLVDLAEAAISRRERHRARASLLRRRAGELRIEVERLRSDLRPSRESGPAPPSLDQIEARFADLEITKELEELRRQRSNRSPQEPAP